MRPGRNANSLWSGMLVILAGLCVSPLSAAINVAILDYQDSWSTTKGLGQILTDVGQPYTDLTSNVLAGQPVSLTGQDVFIIGSFTTANTTLRTALANASTTLNQFVNSGGTVITLTQADQNVAQEAWVQPPAQVTRGDPDFDLVYRVQPAHQVFNWPNVISDGNLQGWRYIGSATWVTSWESFVTYRQVGVLAGDDPSSVTLASIIEAGWGTGRALFLSLAPDKARNIGNTQAKAQAPRLMRNLLAYAETVKAGTAPPIQIYQSGAWTGPIVGRVFHDANGSGTWDAGDTGIAGVGVSDTVDIVLTAADGTYTLPNTGANASLVYLSHPAGYSKTDRWYQAINAGSPASAFDFPLRIASDSHPFDFVQITDLHLGGSGTKPLLIDGLARVAALKNPPAFVLATGDLVNAGGTLSQYDDYVAALATSQVPVFSVFGNHDASGGNTGNYRRYLGPDFYSFDYGSAHFLVVNSIYKTAQQDTWISKDLQLLRGSKRLFIFQHYSPSNAEHTQYASWAADAVFTGHWHSQHTVRVGDTASYNSPNFLFGGIDCSPAGFKVIHVAPTGISTRMRWIADGKRLQIVTPSNSLLVPRDDVQILANAYETSADVVSVAYQVKRDGVLIDSGTLAPQGQWSWTGSVPAAKTPRGGYELQVTSTNDRGEAQTATTTFTVLGLHAQAPAPRQDWPQFGGGPQRGGATAELLEPPLGQVWHYQTGGTLDFASPVLKGDNIYIGVKDRGDFANNGVLALRASDGAREWFTPTPAAVSHSVAVDADRVYACSHGGVVHAFSRSTGQELWNQVLGSPTQRFQYGAPVLLGDQLYGGTYPYFARFDAATGTSIWNQNYGADWISSNACPAASGSTVLVPANWHSDGLKAVNAATGAVLWSYTVYGLHGSPVISGDRVVFSDYDGKIHCASLATGAALWNGDLGGGSSASTPAVAYGIVVAGGTGSIKGFRLDTGALAWNVPIGNSPLKMAPYNNTFAALVGSPTIADHTAYVPCGDGKLYAITLETGALRWSADFGTPLLSAPCISGNTLYLSAFDGNVYALGSRIAFAASADFDDDFDVDQSDFGHLQSCLSDQAIPPSCQDANLNTDSTVDQLDVAVFLDCYTGPRVQQPD